MSVYSIDQFISKLAAMAVTVTIAEHKALEAAAKIVEKEAKSEFGKYQGEIGGYEAWAELADTTKDDRVRNGYTPDDPLLRSGELRDSISHETRALEAIIGSDSDLMVFHELGTENMPPRAVLAPALLRKEEQVVRTLVDYTAVAMLAGSPFSHIPRIEGEG